MREALELIRRDFGSDAAVVDTREVREARWFGLVRGKTFLEVTATDEVAVEPAARTLASVGAQVNFHPHWDSADQEDAQERPERPERPERSPSRAGSWTESINIPEPEFKIHEPEPNVREMLFSPEGFFERLPSESGASPLSPAMQDALLQLYVRLCATDMDESSARRILGQLKNDLTLYANVNPEVRNSSLEFLEKKLFEYVAQRIRATGAIRTTPGRRRTVALVGPTGVGKTTTIAKLAAHYRQREKKQVGLITLDLYRMGAVEQLQTFADVIEVPMLTATSPRAVRNAISRMEDFDLVLIDTAGRSIGEEISIQETRVFLEAAQADEVHLVLSSTVRSRLLTETARRFACLGTSALIITKIDESLGLGNLFSLLEESAIPVSYITNGQVVPDDFEAADASKLATLILSDKQ